MTLHLILLYNEGESKLNYTNSNSILGPSWCVNPISTMIIDIYRGYVAYSETAR